MRSRLAIVFFGLAVLAAHCQPNDSDSTEDSLCPPGVDHLDGSDVNEYAVSGGVEKGGESMADALVFVCDHELTEAEFGSFTSEPSAHAFYSACPNSHEPELNFGHSDADGQFEVVFSELFEVTIECDGSRIEHDPWHPVEQLHLYVFKEGYSVALEVISVDELVDGEIDTTITLEASL